MRLGARNRTLHRHQETLLTNKFGRTRAAVPPSGVAGAGASVHPPSKVDPGEPREEGRFGRVVFALADTFVHSGDAGDLMDLVDLVPVAHFLLQTHARIPDYLRLPLRVLTLAFDAWGVVTAGRPFHRLPLEARRRQVAAWKGSRLGFRRDLIKFFETLAVFGIYSERYPGDYALSSGSRGESHVG